MRIAWRAGVVACFVFLSVAPAATAVQASSVPMLPPVAPWPAAAASIQSFTAAATELEARSPLALGETVESIIGASGGTASVSLVELGGPSPVVWSYNGGEVFTAASTYKLAALMMLADEVATGTTGPDGYVCYEDSDYEDGWFDDYSDGACYTRFELAQRAGLYSDNTAGHMLVRDLGGADALNAWAAAGGATASVFFTDNTTTSNDLAALWTAEAKGKLGGAAAQAWLYPLLTHTATEAGIPAGVASRSTVVHKTGAIDLVENDAALVESGPNGAYVLTVMTDDLGGDAGWQLIASISAAVWTFEAARAH
ncbi:MAG TPA: serine hydrolase [Candidatus Dormibacteraeota bacterium]|nr:serine hydrolase [Candidatus Dormibacteraeota bacterium]